VDYIYVNKTLKIPTYVQIAQSITHAIADGILKYGDRLPTEKEVCRTFSISPVVVKMAYEKLIEDRKIHRIKGKGTYVTNRLTYHTQVHEFYQFETHRVHNEVPYTHHTIMFDIVKEDITAYRMLKLESNEKCYVILRIIKSSQNPVLLQKVYLPQKFFPNLELKYTPNDYLYNLIENKYSHKVKHMHNTFSSINASSNEALLLRVDTDDALYFVRSNIISENDQMIGYVLNYFPGDFTEFEVMVYAH
jgi:GntR family transcriptional regulator